MSEIAVVTETKTTEVRFYPTQFSKMSFMKVPGGFLVGATVQKMSGNYEDSSLLSRQELLELINGLTDLAK